MIFPYILIKQIKILFATICGTDIDLSMEQVCTQFLQIWRVSAHKKNLHRSLALMAFKQKYTHTALSKELNSIKHIIFPRGNEDAGK